MPQPQEQKLQDVVNSLISASFKFPVAALTCDGSRKPSRAKAGAASQGQLQEVPAVDRRRTRGTGVRRILRTVFEPTIQGLIHQIFSLASRGDAAT